MLLIGNDFQSSAEASSELQTASGQNVAALLHVTRAMPFPVFRCAHAQDYVGVAGNSREVDGRPWRLKTDGWRAEESEIETYEISSRYTARF